MHSVLWTILWAVLGLLAFLLFTFLVSLYWKKKLAVSVRELRFRRSLHSPHRPVGFTFVILFTISFAIAWVSGRPVFGLVPLAFAPQIWKFVFRVLEKKRSESLQTTALSFLYALEGLLKMGLSLPAALFRLSDSLPAAFSLALKDALAHFAQGRSLSQCLKKFRALTPLSQVGVCLGVLQVAHEKGLSLTPLLGQMLPRLRAEQASRERLKELRRSLFGQGAIAFLAPWVLSGALQGFQPQLIERFFSSAEAPWLILTAFVWELIGAFFLWRISLYA